MLSRKRTKAENIIDLFILTLGLGMTWSVNWKITLGVFLMMWANNIGKVKIEE